jgi:hypothetical protein
MVPLWWQSTLGLRRRQEPVRAEVLADHNLLLRVNLIHERSALLRR